MKLEVTPFLVGCTKKEQACKVLEEAAEVFGAWQNCERCINDPHIKPCYECDFNDGTGFCSVKTFLADEIADVVQAACNLAYRYGFDMSAAMERCTERQRARGRL